MFEIVCFSLLILAVAGISGGCIYCIWKKKKRRRQPAVRPLPPSGGIPPGVPNESPPSYPSYEYYPPTAPNTNPEVDIHSSIPPAKQQIYYGSNGSSMKEAPQIFAVSPQGKEFGSNRI